MNKKLIAVLAAALMLTACAGNTPGVIEITEDVSETVTDVPETASEETVTEEETSVSTASGESISEESVSEETDEDYEEVEAEEFIADYEEDKHELYEGQSYVIRDLNGDGKEEFIDNINPFGYCTVKYYDSENMKKSVDFEVMSMWGGTWYLSGTNRILNVAEYGHTDGTGSGFLINVYDFTTEDLVPVHVYDADGGCVVAEGAAPEDMNYYVDNRECSLEEFLSETKELSEACEKELGYPLFVQDERNSNNYIFNSVILDYSHTNMYD